MPSQRKLIAYGFLALCLLGCFLVRFRLRDAPLERDEGEYAYAGQLILQGVPPYQHAYNMKFPGTYLAYAVLMKLGGETPTGIHLGLAGVNALTALLLFLLVRRRAKADEPAVVAAVVWSLLSTSPTVLGLAGHATHFVVLFAVAGLLALERDANADAGGEPAKTSVRYLVLGGLCEGLALLMKQPGVFFALFGGAWVLARGPLRLSFTAWRSNLARAALYFVCVALPLALTCAWLFHAGVLGRFWFWTVSYARAYGGIVSFGVGAKSLAWGAWRAVGTSWPLWMLAVVGAVASFRWAREVRAWNAGLFACAFAATSVGLYYRAHYFILLLPVISLWAADGFVVLSRWSRLGERGAGWLVFLLVAVTVEGQREYLLRLEPTEASKVVYGDHPFPESRVVGEYLRSHMNASDAVAVLGSEPEIYFYAQHRAATGYLYMFPLTESQPYAPRMQRELISEVEAAHPRFIVYVNVPPSWSDSAFENDGLSDWTRRYLRGYHAVGIADIHSLPAASEYRFGAEVKDGPRSAWNLLVLERS